MAAFYMTVEGRSRDTTQAIVNSRARFGVESSKDWIQAHTPRFIDFPFKDPEATFKNHLAVVRETKPELTVAPDIMDGRTLSEAVRKGDDLLKHADTVVLVPKTVHPSRVPDRFRVGVPYAGFGAYGPWTLWDFQGCGSVHLLGGGPRKQLQARHYLEIGSVDTASLGKACRFGYWDGISKDAPDGWDYRRRLRESLDNYAAAWS